MSIVPQLSLAEKMKAISAIAADTRFILERAARRNMPITLRIGTRQDGGYYLTIEDEGEPRA